MSTRLTTYIGDIQNVLLSIATRSSREVVAVFSGEVALGLSLTLAPQPPSRLLQTVFQHPDVVNITVAEALVELRPAVGSIQHVDALERKTFHPCEFSVRAAKAFWLHFKNVWDLFHRSFKRRVRWNWANSCWKEKEKIKKGLILCI